METVPEIPPAQDIAGDNSPGRHEEAGKPNLEMPSTSTGKEPQPPSAILGALTEQALRFLSTASNETVISCLVGLCAVTYVALGRVGLVIIGMVSGVVLHSTWLNGESLRDEELLLKERERRRERGIDVAHRILQLRGEKDGNEKGQPEDSAGADWQLYSGKTLNYSDFRPETASALDAFTDAVIRDYVKWWYSPIIPDEESFPSACRQTLTAFILSISAHLSRKRPADTFLDFLTNSSSILIVFLNEISTALSSSPTATAPEAVSAYLSMKPGSNLANILDRKHQAKKLTMVADDVLQGYLNHKTYNCGPAQAFLKQVVAKVVLEMTIQSCSKPEWINGWIVYLLEEGEPELMKEIDVGMGAARDGAMGAFGKEGALQKRSPTDDAPGPDSRDGNKQRRRMSMPVDDMDEAMREAKRLTELIAEEDARRLRESQVSHAGPSDDASESTNTTHGIMTPTSSQSEVQGEGELSLSRNLSTESSRVDLLDSQTLNGAVEATSGPPTKAPFTSFDQLIPQLPPTALQDEEEEQPQAKLSEPLTLHNAKLAIFDDSIPGERGMIRTKPNVEYLIQIEPSSPHHSGWMIARKYADFETLHEIVRRISVISGLGFTEAHSTLPNWKGHTKASLRGELERYLNDAVKLRPLAESEGMKRFLEKDQGLSRSPSATKGGFPGLGWPTPSAFENMGKGMMDVLTKAPKEVAGGGKAFFGGVTGAIGSIGNLGPKKANMSSSNLVSTAGSPASQSHLSIEAVAPPLPPRRSQDSLRNSPIVDTQPERIPQMERRPSYKPDIEAEMRSKPSSSRNSFQGSRSSSRAPSIKSHEELSPSLDGHDFHLPPLPSEISDDYGSASMSAFRRGRQSEDISRTISMQPGAASAFHRPAESMPVTSLRHQLLAQEKGQERPAQQSPRKPTRSKPPLTEQETQVAVELMFAIINELYTLSSAWNIRRTLLTAAKTYLLRPGNPQLENIRQLLQVSVIEANTSDAGIAAHIRKLRENTLPTEEELKGWPKEMSAEEKERLRVKARKLLVERGMPQALTSVMGGAASGEALGKVFDCLQMEEVARGLIFGLLLQAVRVVTH